LVNGYAHKGKKLLGIRLDSGDLHTLASSVVRCWIRAGFQDTFILASNELDETVISELKRQGAKIDAWGVGTHLVTGKKPRGLWTGSISSPRFETRGLLGSTN